MEATSKKLIVSLAGVDDIDDIRDFIDSEWKQGHILARNRAFFQYEHQHNAQVNFVISRNEDNEIMGVLGFIPSAVGELSDVSTVIWKVSKKSKNPILGVQLLNFLKQVKGVRNVLSVGINEKTIGIYKYLGMYTDKLAQFVLINPKINLENFKIAKINKSIDYFGMMSQQSEYRIKLIEQEPTYLDFAFEEYKENIPYKNREYFIKRYFRHPIYKYNVYSIYFHEKSIGVFVTRVQEYNASKVLRVVDFIGKQEQILSIGNYLRDLMVKENYEYADFYCFGIDKTILQNAEFQEVSHFSDEIIIPNYFAPFQQKNIMINFFVDTREIHSLRIFKADGDQDRPN